MNSHGAVNAQVKAQTYSKPEQLLVTITGSSAVCSSTVRHKQSELKCTVQVDAARMDPADLQQCAGHYRGAVECW